MEAGIDDDDDGDDREEEETAVMAAAAGATKDAPAIGSDGSDCGLDGDSEDTDPFKLEMVRLPVFLGIMLGLLLIRLLLLLLLLDPSICDARFADGDLSKWRPDVKSERFKVIGRCCERGRVGKLGEDPEISDGHAGSDDPVEMVNFT